MSSHSLLVHLDLNYNELQNTLLQNLATLPTFTANTNGGFICYHTATNKLMLWSGTAWIDVSNVYQHPSFPGVGQPSSPLTGAKVVSQITLDNGHVTNVVTRDMTPADIGAATALHTHNFASVIGLPSQTILGNNTGGVGEAQALTVADIMTMLSIAYGNATILTAGTDTVQRTWSAKMLTDWVNAKISGYITSVNLTLGTRTGTTLDINNSAGTGVTLPSATTTQAGLQSGEDKTKLDGIQAGANNYVHPQNNPGTHPFQTNLTSGVTILSQLVVNSEGHVIQIKGRDLTAADIATILFNNSINNSTTQTWSSSKIYTEIQNAIGQAQTGALQYKGEYNPSTNTPDIKAVGTGVKVGWTYVVTGNGTFAGQDVESGDMIVAKVDNPGSSTTGWQIVNKNIPAIVSASATVEGIIILATVAEAIDGTNNTKAITPYTLKAVLNATVGGYSVDIGDGSGTTFTVTHGLNTTDVTVQLQRVSDKKFFIAETSAPTTTTVIVSFNRPPQINQYRVIIKK